MSFESVTQSLTDLKRQREELAAREYEFSRQQQSEEADRELRRQQYAAQLQASNADAERANRALDEQIASRNQAADFEREKFNYARAKDEREAVFADPARQAQIAEVFGMRPKSMGPSGVTFEREPDQITQQIPEGMRVKGATRNAEGKISYSYENPDAQVNTSTTQNDIDEAVSGIVNGSIPPEISSMTSFRDRTRVIAALTRNGFDLSKAASEWKSTQKFLASMNSEKQIRLRQALSSVSDALDNVEALSNEFSRSGFTPLNKAQIAVAASGIGPQADLAREYLGQISIIQDELGQVFMGGNSPTERALELAAKTIGSGDWTQSQMSATIKNIRDNLRYRINAINNADVYTGTAGNQGPVGSQYAPNIDSVIPQGQRQQIDKKAIAVQALNDPEATPEEQAQARKILGM